MRKRIFSFVLVIAIVTTILPILPVSAATSINIGDYVQMGTYYGKPIIWRCVDMDENGPLMLSDKIICIKPFDAETSANSTTGSHSRNSYRDDYGSNYWADSNMRSWLNSSEGAGNVEWLCGNTPSENYVWSGYNEYDQEAGFLSNFTSTEKSAIKTVTQKSIVAYPEYENGIYTEGSERHSYINSISSVVANYDSAYAEQVTDTIFLLGVKQVNRVYQNSNILGDEYYIGEPTQEAVDNSEFKYSSLTTGEKWYYWLRSPHADGDNSVRCVISDGDVYSSSANSDNFGVRPAFYLNQLSVIYKSGNGSQTDPYVIDGNGTTGESVSVIGDYNGKIAVSREVNDNTVTFTITAVDGDISDYADIKLFIAEYSSDRSLRNISFGVNEIIDNKLKITANIPSSDIYKLMLWDNNLTSIINALTDIQ